jgi:hypothetical protein
VAGFLDGPRCQIRLENGRSLAFGVALDLQTGLESQEQAIATARKITPTVDDQKHLVATCKRRCSVDNLDLDHVRLFVKGIDVATLFVYFSRANPLGIVTKRVEVSS